MALPPGRSGEAVRQGGPLGHGALKVALPDVEAARLAVHSKEAPRFRRRPWRK